MTGPGSRLAKSRAAKGVRAQKQRHGRRANHWSGKTRIKLNLTSRPTASGPPILSCAPRDCSLPPKPHFARKLSQPRTACWRKKRGSPSKRHLDEKTTRMARTMASWPTKEEHAQNVAWADNATKTTRPFSSLPESSEKRPGTCHLDSTNTKAAPQLSS